MRRMRLVVLHRQSTGPAATDVETIVSTHFLVPGMTSNVIILYIVIVIINH